MKESLFQSPEIDELHSLLNSKDNAPRRGYRRNVEIYELVCYVNNIIACYLSHNEKPIPVFIERAKIFLKEHGSAEWKEYCELVGKYLATLENHLSKHGVDINVENQ